MLKETKDIFRTPETDALAARTQSDPKTIALLLGFISMISDRPINELITDLEPTLKSSPINLP